MNVQPFSPQTAGTITVSVTQSAASTAFPTLNASCYLVQNVGPNTAFHTVTVAAATASVSTSVPIAAGAIMVFSMPEGAAFFNNICNTSQTATVYVTPGEGQ